MQLHQRLVAAVPKILAFEPGPRRSIEASLASCGPDFNPNAETENLFARVPQILDSRFPAGAYDASVSSFMPVR
jgi:hypothetical protein